MSHF
ncbi:hypothetical protein F383_06630 [Gossypium arboreum]|jgi:hypothetical protein